MMTLYMCWLQDIGQWYRSIQSRLKDIPSSSTDYQTLLNTIQQLQVHVLSLLSLCLTSTLSVHYIVCNMCRIWLILSQGMTID